ncbi:hypothetical protein V5O48_007679 [Marasmius crinis-equi]|uniref:Cytochrome P450 n=1 Tax=Marasmius crinis-equi TaxID=585013 RepID=A0ABR3FFZ3_9AGAR
MSVLYGKRCPRYESYEATTFYKSNRLWNLALEPGAHPPVDLLPILDYLPERWAPWKKLAREARHIQRGLYFGLVTETEERMRRGEENGCYMEEVIARQKEFLLDREMVGYLGGVMLEGGSETTASFLHSLVLFLVASPESQRKAQEEIDRVIGRERLPNLEDIHDLPYIRALIKETHRYRPVAPLQLPHATIADEEMLNTMNLVWAFDFKPAKDADGQDIPADVNAYEKGIIPGPKPFDCIAAPRHAKVAEIIQREFREATDTFVKFERDLAPEDKEFVAQQRAGL